MTRYMDLKVDFAFKLLFGTEGNEPILLALLNAILKLPKDQQIVSVTIMNSELFREHEEGKSRFWTSMPGRRRASTSTLKFRWLTSTT